MSEYVAQFLLDDKVKETFEILAQLLGIHSAIFTTDFHPILSGAGLPMCRHCHDVRRLLGMDEKCYAQDRLALEKVAREGGVYNYRCHAGLREMAIPIYSQNKVIGYIIIGQFRDPKQKVSPYRQLWKKKFKTDQLQQDYEKTPVLTQEQIQGLKRMISHFMKEIEERSLIVLKDFDLLIPLIEKINQKPGRYISMQEAMETIGRSCATINRLFKRLTGTSFKQYQIEVLLNEAERRMRAMPNRPISLLAFELGVEDALYFSRLYRLHRKKSPSDFIEACLKEHGAPGRRGAKADAEKPRRKFKRR